MVSNKKVRPPRHASMRPKRANGQGSIYFDKRKNRYVVAVSDFAKPGRRRKKSFFTLREAEAFCYEFVRNKGLGKSSLQADPKIKVSVFLASWHKTVRREEETCRSYDTAIRNWINPHIGNVKIADLTPAIIEGLYARLDEIGHGDSVLHITHTVLSLAFKEAIRLSEVSYNPMLNVRKIRKKVLPLKHIPRQDADKIYLEASKDPFTHARIEIGMVVGLRPGEALGLKWSDIDWRSRTITIERQLQRSKGAGLAYKALKTHDFRVLPLSMNQIEILKVHQIVQETSKVFWRRDFNLIFPNRDGQPKDSRADHRDWKKLLIAAGVTTSYTRYQMRKTAITNLITNGIDEKTVATIAGHSSPVVTMKHYANATSDSMLAALRVQDSIRPRFASNLDVNIEEQVSTFIKQLENTKVGE